MSRLGWSVKHLPVFTESFVLCECRKHHFALIERVSFGKTSNCPFPWKRTGSPFMWRPWWGRVRCSFTKTWQVLLGFLDLSLAGAFTQVLLGFERWRWSSGGSMMVVFLRSTQRGSEQQVASPGLNEGKGGAVRVSGGHHHLQEDGASQRRSVWFVRTKGAFHYFSSESVLQTRHMEWWQNMVTYWADEMLFSCKNELPWY